MLRGLVAAVVLCAMPAHAWAQAAILTYQSEFKLDPEQGKPGGILNFIFIDDALYITEQVGERTSHADQPLSQLVALDPVTGNRTVAGKALANRSYRPIAILDDYIVAQGGAYNRISLLDRKTGIEVGAKRLANPVLDAVIRDGVLYLLQNTGLSRFSVPRMDFIDERILEPGGLQGHLTRDGAFWIRARRKAPDFEIVFTPFDAAQSQRSITAARQADTVEQHCPPALSAFRGKHAVVDRGCGNHMVVDVEQMRIAYDVPRLAPTTRVNFAFLDKFLVAQPDRYAPGMAAPASIIDLVTGREIGRQILPEAETHGVGDRLALISAGFGGERRTVKTFRVDESVAFNTTRQEADIREAYARARWTDDPYRAAQIMDGVALDPMMRSLRTGADEYLHIARFYAAMVALDPSRASEGIDLFEQLTAWFPDRVELKIDLAQARRSALLLDHDSTMREPTLEAVWKPASQRPLRAATSYAPGIQWMDDDGFAIFDGDRVFMSRRSFDDSVGDDGQETMGMDVHDRKTLELQRHIPLVVSTAPSGWSDHFDDAKIVDGRIWIATTPNGGGKDAGQPTMFVYDTQTLELIKSWRKNGEETFVATNGAMLTYPCWNRDEAFAYDLKTLERVASPIPDFCENDRYLLLGGGMTPRALERAKELQANIQAVTDSYVVLKRYRERGSELVLAPLSDAPPIETSRAMSREYGVWGVDREFLYAEGDTFVAIDITRRAISFLSFDLTARAWRTLFSFKPMNYVRAASDGRTLFVALDSDVVAIDIKSGAILDFVNIFGGDTGMTGKPSMPHALKVDRGRLLVFARWSTAIVDLEKFYAGADASGTPYARVKQRLMER